MLIKKLPGADGQPRPISPGGTPAVDPDASRLLTSGPDRPLPGDGEEQLSTARLDALRQALGNSAILPRNHVLQNRYEIEQVLGVGGMSTVYRARDLRFTNVLRYCAVKEMPDNSPDPSTGALHFANFEREASLLATLNHAAIPKIYDFFYEEGRVYLVLEHVEGKDLEMVLDETGRALPEDQVLEWANQICDVLSYLHGHQPQSIVFRDLKPSNIMVDPTGTRITLVDFGIAKTLQTEKKGTMIGTEGYSPPEQYRGLAEPRGDVYALGATMHHLLTMSDPRTETPFTFHERPIRQLNQLISADTEALVVRALEYDSSRRWESAAEMRAAINAIQGRHGGPMVPGASVPAPAEALPRPNLGAGRPPAPPAAPVMAAPSRAPVAPVPMPAGPRVAAAPDGSVQPLWTFAAEDEIRSSPVVVKGAVFVGSYDSNLYALNAKTGEFIWKRATEAGICSSPLVSDDLVIFGSEDNNVYAVDARRGVTAWTFATGGPIRSSPRVVGGRVYIGSDDQHLYCLDARTGRLGWKYRAWGPVRSSPAVGRGFVYVGCSDGNLYAVEIDTGNLKWKFHTSGPITSSPAVQDAQVFVGSNDQHIYALDGENGWPVWKYRTEHYVLSSPAVGGGRVFVGSVDGKLYALEHQSGRLAWKYDAGSQVASPRLAGALVYVGTVDGYLCVVTQADGDLRWRFQTRGPITSTPAIDDGIVYIGSLDHYLYALPA